MPVTMLPFLTTFYFTKEGPLESLISLKDFSKKLTTIIENVALIKKGR